MRFHCQVNDLQTALNTATKAISPRPSATILEGVLLETCPEGVRLTCSDLSLGIETLASATVVDEGRIVLPGKLLAEVIRKLPSDVVDLDIDDNRRTVIRCAGSRTVLTGFSPEEYPELPRVENEPDVTFVQSDLRDMIQKTNFSVASDESRPILTGSLLEADETGLTMVALDGFRMAICRLKNNAELRNSFRVVIPGKVLSDLSKILENGEEPVTLSLSPTHACFDRSGTRLVARLLEGEFIQYRQILPREWQTSVELPVKALEEAIDRAALIARESKNNLVRFQIDQDRFLITSNAELGEIREEVTDIRVEGKSLEIAFNVRYLSDILRVVSDTAIRMQFQNSISPCVICPQEGDAYLYLVLPVRIYTA